MHVAVLFVLGGALFDAGARSVGCGGGFFGRLASLAWSLGLVVATVWAAGEWRRSRRASEKRDFESYRVGHEAGKKYVASSGSDELNWFDYAMQVFYARYCSDEKLLSNWVRVTVEAALEGLEIAGLRGITIPYLVLGQKRIHVLKTSPWRYEQRPGELYLDLTLRQGRVDRVMPRPRAGSAQAQASRWARTARTAATSSPSEKPSSLPDSPADDAAWSGGAAAPASAARARLALAQP
jgi:hypothetical protein